jgi:hypothetical protein
MYADAVRIGVRDRMFSSAIAFVKQQFRVTVPQ